MITCAIAGSHSFIATHLIAKLKRQEYKVIGIPRAVLYDLVTLERFFSEVKPSFIINCASYGNMYSQDIDFETVFANVIIPMNLLETSINLPYDGFINFSSSSVMLPFVTFYAASKAGGEKLLTAFTNKYNKPCISVRPYTVTGVGEQKEHLIPKLIESCIEQKEMNFVPEPVHDYIGVEDLCNFILLVMDSVKDFKGKTLEVGSGIGTSNDEVRKIVEKVTGKKAILKIVKSLRPYDSGKWVAKSKSSKLQSLESIITDMVKDYEFNHKSKGYK